MTHLIKDFNSFVGKFLQTKRIDNKKTIKQVAKILNMRPSTYSDKEAGVGISILFLIEYAKLVLNVPVEIFFNEVNEAWITECSEKTNPLNG